MSWYGTHPKITKDEARKLLPHSGCRRCVYWARVYQRAPYACSGCGGAPIAMVIDPGTENRQLEFVTKRYLMRVLLLSRPVAG